MAFDSDSFGSPLRRRVFMTTSVVVLSIFALRLFQLQIIEGAEYRVRSDAQGIKKNVRMPIRGSIYDRYGRPIVANIPGYTVVITPNRITPKTKAMLARILRTDTTTINERINQYKTNEYSPVRVWRDVDARAWAMLNEHHTELRGVDIVDESKRAYVSRARASHILGYTKEIDRGEIGLRGDWYDPGDIIGKVGIERAWEDYLRGEKGFEFVMVNSRGQRVGPFADGRSDRRASNGFDLYLGLDVELQEYAEECLKGYRGAVVALDPTNGEILAMASSPDFDPMTFSGVTSSSDYARLADDPSKPLLNRATQAIYPPGSTWKPLMTIAGLMEGIITPTSTISCPGSFTYGGNTWKCHGGHGSVTPHKAIHASCNVFYYKLALQLGIDNYTKYGRLFHFGEKLDLDVTEGRTRLPSREYYDRSFGEGKWGQYVLVNLGIGQGELGVSPVQLAAYVAAIANGGVWHQPHLVRGMRNVQLGTYERTGYVSDDLHIPGDIIDLVQAAMFDVVNTAGGTAAGARIPDIQVAGKTGTAQAGKGKRDHAWFICYAPFEKPKIALCVLVENSGFGGTYSAPISRKLIKFYLKRQKETASAVDSTFGGPLVPLAPWDSADVQESAMLPESQRR